MFKTKFGIVSKSGAWFGYKDLRIGQGRDNAKTYLEEHPEIAAEIEEQIRAKLAGEAESEKAPKATAAAKEEKAAPAKRISKADIDILVDDE